MSRGAVGEIAGRDRAQADAGAELGAVAVAQGRGRPAVPVHLKMSRRQKAAVRQPVGVPGSVRVGEVSDGADERAAEQVSAHVPVAPRHVPDREDTVHIVRVGRAVRHDHLREQMPAVVSADPDVVGVIREGECVAQHLGLRPVNPVTRKPSRQMRRFLVVVGDVEQRKAVPGRVELHVERASCQLAVVGGVFGDYWGRPVHPVLGGRKADDGRGPVRVVRRVVEVPRKQTPVLNQDGLLSRTVVVDPVRNGIQRAEDDGGVARVLFPRSPLGVLQVRAVDVIRTGHEHRRLDILGVARVEQIPLVVEPHQAGVAT